MDVNEVVAAYTSAWSQPDEEARRELLEQGWAEGGVYIDPTARVEGREALVKHITGFLERFAGHRFELPTQVDEHSGYLRFEWHLVGPDDAPVLQGMDFGRLDESGRLSLIVGFFGPFPLRS